MGTQRTFPMEFGVVEGITMGHQPNEIAIINTVQRWVETFVVGLNVCPFAKREVVKNRVRYCVSQADTRELLTADLERELNRLKDNDAIETSLLIHPGVLQDFYDYNDFLHTANTLVRVMGLDGVFQVASFHPNYQFAGTEPADAENHTNRSPYPILHLLREKSLTVAIDAYPGAEDIPNKNIKIMNELGGEYLQNILKQCFN